MTKCGHDYIEINPTYCVLSASSGFNTQYFGFKFVSNELLFQKSDERSYLGI